MFSKFFSRKKEKRQECEVVQVNEQDYDFKWYEVGEGNPFNKRILDCRSLTQTVLATTTEKHIAEKYNALRSSNGKELLDIPILNQSSRKCALCYPHNGAKLEGIVYKADSMDVKWDIYIYNNIFYFSRSWTGDLVYKAFAEITDDCIRINKIDYSCDEILDKQPELVEDNVHFLIMSHALGKVYTHPIPRSFQDEDMKNIALYSFNIFGNKACYATKDGILDTEITLSKS